MATTNATAPLVGREREIELLVRALDAASQGDPRFVLVTGEAGVGKSRLLAEAADLAAGRGCRVLIGTGIEGGVNIPYLPLVAALEECERTASGDAADDVRRFLDARTSPSEERGARAARLLESIFTVLVREPTLLVVDDVHWVDGSTITLLDYVAHRARFEPLALFCAARDDEVEARHLQIADGRRFTILNLPRLAESAVAKQLEGIMGTPPESSLVSAVFRRSAGNPFFVEQLVAHGTDTRPASLRTLMSRRLKVLSAPARRATDALAVVGRAADETLVGAVAAMTDERVAAALFEATERGITQATEEGFAFRHPLFGEIVAAELSGPSRRRLHRRAAEALDLSRASAAERAHHWWEAGDGERARASCLEAAEDAERMLAFSEMRLQLERAVETWPDGARGADVQLFRAAEAAWLAGDASGARSLAQQAFDQGAAVDPERLAALGNYAWDTGDFPGAVEAFERAGSLLTNETASSVRAESLIGLARARTTRGQYAAACRIATDAIREARSACALSAEARGLFIRGIAKVFAGDLSGVEDLERGVLRAVEARSPAAVGHGYQYLTNCVRYSGTLERALAIAREGIDACDRLGLARSHGSDLRAWAAAFLIELGRWDEAAALLSTADSRAPVHLGSGTLAMRKGRFAHARTELDRAAASGWIAGRRGLDGSLELARAELSWLTGDLAEASAALAEMPELPDTLPVASLVSRRARLLFRIAADDPRHAPATLPEPDPRDVRYDASCVRAEIEAERVRAAGNVDPQLWSACVRAWERTGIVYDATYARFRYAEALLSAGERDQAKDALRQAATDASGLGALPLRALVDDLARRARLVSSPQRRRTASYDELTARECDVLALLADGLTNREIAGRLFLSAKTVGIHVTHLLQKLDAHTRGEAVAAARRRGLIE